MKAFILSDGEYATAQLEALDAVVKRVLSQKGFAITEKRLMPGELGFCMGCFGCWIKTPGECVIKDSMADINRDFNNSDVTVYLAPVVFGQYSANMKNAIDRWIPNILPFFIARPDGSTMHPARYDRNPQIILIGYGDDLTDTDCALFYDITTRHRDNGEVLFYTGDDAKMGRVLSALKLERLGAVI